MKNSIYRIDDNSLDNLKKLNFYHMGEGVYCHRFPVFKHGKYVTLFGVFIANDENKDIHVDVFDENGFYYSPYYKNDKSSDVIRIINKNVKNEMEKCNIKRLKRKESCYVSFGRRKNETRMSL